MRKLLDIRQNTFEKDGIATHKELWNRAKSAGYEGLTVQCIAKMEAVEDVVEEITEEQKANGETPKTVKRFHSIFSTEVEDRHREIVYQDFDVTSFKKNPVFLDSHRSGSIDAIIGNVRNLKAKKGSPLEGDIEFATMNPRGLMAEQMVEAKFAHATSIGFIPKEFDEKGNIVKSELLEISLVSVPANPEALIDHEKSIKSEEEEVTETPVVEETPVIEEKKLPTAEEVIEALRAESKRKQALLRSVADEIQAIAAPGARKRQVMQAIRTLLEH